MSSTATPQRPRRFFLPALIFGPISLLITWLGLKPYEREVKRLKDLEGLPA